MVRTIKINNSDFPISFNSRAIGTWSHAMQIPMRAFANLSDDITILQSVHLLYYCLQEGARLENKVFNITLDNCWIFIDDNTLLLGELFELMAESRNVTTDQDENINGEKKMKSHSKN